MLIIWTWLSSIQKKPKKGRFYLSKASSVFRIEYKKLVAYI